MAEITHIQSERVSSGLPAMGDVPWGSHLCHFYRTKRDLQEVLVPFFQCGLENGDQCLWVTAEPFGAAEARAALLKAVPDLERYEERGQIEILGHAEWYERVGDLDTAGVLAAWVERERQALARGYRGLRLTGNTYFLDHKDWEDFAEYEAAVHRLFHTRQVLALCSYSLERCTMDNALDVLYNHEGALVRTGDGWEVVRSATELVAAIRESRPQPAPAHLAHFYSDGMFPAEAIAELLAEAVANGEQTAAIATQAHLKELREALEARGVEWASIQTFDAEATADSCMENGQPSLVKFREAVEWFLSELIGDGEATIYGEMVNVLCERSQTATAIALEGIWNELMGELPLKLYCGYDLSHFRDGSAHEHCLAVCGSHGEVRIDATAEDQRIIARALSAEIEYRRALESVEAHNLALQHMASARLARLQRITAALSTVQTLEQLSPVLEGDVQLALDAKPVVVFAEIDGQEEPECFGECEQSARALARRVHDLLLEMEGSYEGRSLWLRDEDDVDCAVGDDGAGVSAVAGFPLRVAGRRIGTFVVGFGRAQRFDTAQRALIEDVARQMALALDRMLLYEEAQRQRREVERASRAKDEFLAMLGHELRNPLAAIRTASELLKYVTKDEAILRTQGVLERQSTHMTKLIDGLLDVSRIVRGKVVLDKQDLDLRAIVENVLQDHGVQFETKQLELVVELPEEPVRVHGDRVRLTQVFDNLVANALEFTPQGGTIRVELRCEGGHGVLSVCDSGLGIEPELLPYIFEQFQQGKQDLARTKGGLGLGLAVVKGLVDLHGGQVEARSEGPGRGAEFEVRLELAGLAGSTQEAIEEWSVPGRSSRILLVEDNLDAAELMQGLLEAMGHNAVVAHDGVQAMEMAQSYRPAVIFCDIGLPGEFSGYDVARQCRQDAALCTTRLVALTGYGTPDDVQRARAAGFDTHLTKPVDLPTIEQLLGSLGH